ncbi:MAG: diaminopimelate decarboxylase [Bacteroidota bacterium]|nr:diaminopimelate decarboxylase [Candidatus Kapabacteria bacterium]MCS7302148.1 diaminopimelate decarboxylase [Candidatus Kapabacteria bacterium]MCX7936423.1 diaminopimelate decarboxylase [Chlorobiota bacterium]MDW8074297.1 diaminopimelate decarboxylase [Bacteroidota bacterium]
MTGNNQHVWQPSHVQGVSLLELAEKFGTPLYVYDGAQIVERYNYFVASFDRRIPLAVKFACKALPSLAIIELLHRCGAGVDAVSIEEVELALRTGVPAKDICFTPNCVNFEEIQKGVEYGVIVNIDDLSLLERFGHTYGSRVGCGIRINPHIVAGGNPHIQVGHIDSKFGISILQLRHLLRIVQNYGIRVVGLHMHTGSDIYDPEVFVQAASVLFDVAEHFPDLEFIDLGSGFKVPYKPDDVATDIRAFGQTMSQAFLEFCERYGRMLALWFEPGKYLVSQAGYLLVEVTVVKQTVSSLFVGVNSGFNHLIRPMFYDAYHHIVNLSNPQGKPRIYSVVGYICETDTFAWDRPIAEVREGDILCIMNAGAYGIAMSSNYNARRRPAEVLVLDGIPYLIRRRETLEDLIAPQRTLSEVMQQHSPLRTHEHFG